MRVRLTGRSHNRLDTTIPRFDLRIPNFGTMEADLPADQVAILQADPYLLVEGIEETPAPETALSERTKAELLDLIAERGLNAPPRATKAQLIALLAPAED